MKVFQTGRLDEARTLFTELARFNPRNSDAFCMLGLVYGHMGRLQEAERFCRQAIAITPGHFAARDHLGTALLMQGRSDEAIRCLEKALQINPESAPTFSNLGNACRQCGRIQEAESYYKKALSLNPEFIEAYNNLGNIYKDLCRLDEAENLYRKALGLNRNYIDAWFNLGAVQTAGGEYKAAIESYRQTLSLQPNYLPAVAAVASVYEKQKEYTRSAAELEPWLNAGTVAPPIALAYAEVSPHINQRENAARILEGALKCQGVAPIERQEMLFALGKLYDGMKQFDTAFAHYKRANESRNIVYNPAVHRQQMGALKRTFSRELVSSLPQAVNDSEKAVFIVGMPRSGTSLVEQILASHPDVFGAGELDNISSLIAGIPRRFGMNYAYPECIADLDGDQLQLMAREYLDSLESLAPAAKRITDKMPHNFLHLGFIGQLFPRARVIHCLRDPMDTCLSIYFHNFNANHPYASHLASLAEYYRDYLGLMDHWKSVLNIPVIEVHYEELVANQEDVSRHLVEFCGLDWDQGCLDFHKTERTVNTPSYGQVRQPIYRGSVKRWKNYEPFLGPLKEGLGAYFV